MTAGEGDLEPHEADTPDGIAADSGRITRIAAVEECCETWPFLVIWT